MILSITIFLFGRKVIATMFEKKSVPFCWELDSMLQRKLRWINVYLQVPIDITDRVLQEVKNGYVEKNVGRHEGNFIKKWSL